MDNKSKKFPSGFFWGAATSAHQVEGGNHNDWSEWEQANSARLVENAKQNANEHMRIKFPEMLQKENYVSGRTCDHYNKFEEDFNLAAAGGHNAHRFSIEWSRIEPEEGRFNEEAIDHYRKVIQALKNRNLEPFITLWHYTLPVWFSKKGGWENKDSLNYFVRFVEKIVGEYKDSVKFWITFNEPILLTVGEYIKGYRPPQKHNLFSALRVWRNLVEAHKLAYEAIHKINPEANVGLSEWLNYFDDRKAILRTGLLSNLAKYFANEYILKKVSNNLDFIGVQYYMRLPFSLRDILGSKKFQQNDMGWEIFPEGMFEVLKDMKKYKLPIYITENGIPDAEDSFRSRFIRENIMQIKKAVDDGVDVRGYFYWSLLDNFEWDKGFWPRFGLVEIDYKTLERKPRKSFWEYKKMIENNF